MEVFKPCVTINSGVHPTRCEIDPHEYRQGKFRGWFADYDKCVKRCLKIAHVIGGRTQTLTNAILS
ncbi:hypothetical protein [Dokdonella soli]|uniref:Uncharacterized protein n=1 Tax=Dokdonella soli TaxID=529810 RepID=A0ABN1IU36_9GAMM